VGFGECGEETSGFGVTELVWLVRFLGHSSTIFELRIHAASTCAFVVNQKDHGRRISPCFKIGL
jgi:hypothetical protein